MKSCLNCSADKTLSTATLLKPFYDPSWQHSYMLDSENKIFYVLCKTALIAEKARDSGSRLLLSEQGASLGATEVVVIVGPDQHSGVEFTRFTPEIVFATHDRAQQLGWGF
jgi:hypothetical protein